MPYLPRQIYRHLKLDIPRNQMFFSSKECSKFRINFRYDRPSHILTFAHFFDGSTFGFLLGFGYLPLAYKLIVKNKNEEQTILKKSAHWHFLLTEELRIEVGDMDMLIDPTMGYLNENDCLEVEWILKCMEAEFPSYSFEEPYFARLYDEKGTADFTFIIGKKELRVHKCVMVLNSPTFKAMLNQNCIEGNESRIVVHDFDFETVDLSLKLMYEKNIFEGLRLESAQKIYVEDFLKTKLTLGNLWMMTEFAILRSATELLKECKTMLIINLEFIAELKGYDSVEPGVMKEIMRIIASGARQLRYLQDDKSTI